MGRSKSGGSGVNHRDWDPRPTGEWSPSVRQQNVQVAEVGHVGPLEESHLEKVDQQDPPIPRRSFVVVGSPHTGPEVRDGYRGQDLRSGGRPVEGTLRGGTVVWGPRSRPGPDVYPRPRVVTSVVLTPRTEVPRVCTCRCPSSLSCTIEEVRTRTSQGWSTVRWCRRGVQSLVKRKGRNRDVRGEVNLTYLSTPSMVEEVFGRTQPDLDLILQ